MIPFGPEGKNINIWKRKNNKENQLVHDGISWLRLKLRPALSN